MCLKDSPGIPGSAGAVQETLGGLPPLPYVAVDGLVVQCSRLQSLHLFHLAHLPRHVDLLLEEAPVLRLIGSPLLGGRLAGLIAFRPESVDRLPQMQLDVALVAIVHGLHLKV